VSTTTGAQRTPESGDERRSDSGGRTDLVVAAGALLLVLAAGVTPFLLSYDPRAELDLTVAPLLANFIPHVGPGTPAAVVLAAATVAWGPAVAQRLPWRRLLGTSYVVSLAWAMSLALVDGWTRGFTAKLTTYDEYLAGVPGVTDIHQMLQTFTTRILDCQPGRWTTRVAAHPPGAFGVYLGLDRVGLGGGTWASIVTVLVGCAAPGAVLVTVRAPANHLLVTTW